MVGSLRDRFRASEQRFRESLTPEIPALSLHPPNPWAVSAVTACSLAPLLELPL